MATPKPKLAFVIDDGLDRNDGVQQYVKTLGRWFLKNGHEVVYFAGQTKLDQIDGAPVYSLARNFKVSFNGNKLSIPLPAKKAKINNALQKENPDILHVQVPHSPFMAQKIVNLWHQNAGVLGTFHIMPAGKLQVFASKLLSIYYGKGLNKFDKFVSVSQPAKHFAEKTFNITSEVLPNVVNVSSYKNHTDRNKKRIVFLGRLVERKGAAHLLEACGILKKKISDFELVIAGDGPQREQLEAQAEKLGIKQNVKFLGYINEQDKPSLLGSATIACFPSVYGESFGIVLIEAMAAGSKVVLGGNNPGYSSVLGPKDEQLFDPHDHKKLSQTLYKFLTDEAAAEAAADWQHEQVKQFDVPVVGAKLEAIYSQLIVKKRVK